MKHLYLWVISFLIPLLSVGQDLITHSIDALEGMDIQEIIQSSSGELLLIDKQKLYSFDGYRLSTKVDLQVHKTELSTLLELGSKIFLGDYKGNIFIYENEHLDSVKLMTNGRVEKMVQKSDTELFILSKGEELWIYDFGKKENESLRKSPRTDLVNDLITENSVYLATDHGLFLEPEPDADLELILASRNAIITHIIKGDTNEIWTSDFYGEISCYNESSNEWKSVSLGSEVKVTDIQYGNSCLYVSTDDGVYQVCKGPNGQLVSKRVNKGVTRGLLIDDEANLWMLKDERVDFALLHFLKFKPPSDEDIHSQTAFSGRIILGTESKLLAWYVRNSEISIIEAPLNVTCIDHSESLLAVGTYDSGLLLFSADLDDKVVLTRTEGLADNTVLAIKFLGQDHIIASTLAGVNEVLKENGKWVVKGVFRGLEKYYMLTVMKDLDGRVWFGTDNRGVVRVEGSMTLTLDRTKSGKEIGSVSSLCETRDSTVWMISEKAGLVKCERDTIYEVASPHGTWGKYTSIIPLKGDRLMLIGEREISVFDAKDWEMMEFSDELNLERGRSFFNNYAQENGSVFFEHGGYLYRFIDDGGRNRSQSITHLNKLEVNLSETDTSIHDFSEFENSIQFYYSGILYRDPGKIRYSYRLIGFDEEWRSTNDRQVAYPNLPPGEFRFQVRSSHDSSQEGSEIISYDFKIHRKFYNKTWFRVLLLVIFLSILYGLNRRRRKAKEMADKLVLLSTEAKLLNLRSQLNPHFLFNSFNTVIGLIEEDKERSIAFVEKLTDFFRRILEIGETELISIDTELKLLRDYIHLMTERFGNGLKVHFPESMEPSLVPPLSLQLLVENAVKHNVIKESEPLDIYIEETEDFIIVRNVFRPRTSIKDTLGIGLENLKERYLILAKKEIVIEKNDHMFKVLLPRIQAPIS